MIDRIVQMYDAFMAMPIEGQIITGAGALVVIAATRTVWKIAYPVRWTAASTLRLSAWLIHPRKRKATSRQVASNDIVPFDFSTKEKAKAAYAFYAGTDMVQTMSVDQMDLLSEAFELYNLRGNMGLTNEKNRRQMQEKMDHLQKMAEVEQASRAPVTVEVQQVEPIQQRQASMENVA
tara:strand:- start:672 stop:1205 length:534 start_codon:yes stop_codon:yes gene_type:complete